VLSLQFYSQLLRLTENRQFSALFNFHETWKVVEPHCWVTDCWQMRALKSRSPYAMVKRYNRTHGNPPATGIAFRLSRSLHKFTSIAYLWL